MNPFIAVGLLLNSALYLTGALALAIVEHDHVASRLALLACGVTYLSYLAHQRAAALALQHPLDGTPFWPGRVAAALVWLSIFLGASAGFALLVR